MSTNNEVKERKTDIFPSFDIEIERLVTMDSAKAEAENIAPSAGKELLDKFWSDVKQEIDEINIVSDKKICRDFLLTFHLVF